MRVVFANPHTVPLSIPADHDTEMLVWQSSRRVVGALIIGAAAVLLRVSHLLSGAVWPVLAVVPSYAVAVALVALIAERRRRAAPVALVVLALVDVAAIFGAAGLTTDPVFYGRALLLSVLILQFTQLFDDAAPVITVTVGSTAAFLGLLASAAARGAAINWGEELCELALYLLVALNSVRLHRSAARRLGALVDLFAAAQRGDFSRPFSETRRLEPDGVTLLGRAYNQLRSELAILVHTDALTGCLNRRGLDYMLGQATAAAMRRGGVLALLAVDVDHFKSVNDTAGHLAGDAVLKELADLLVRSSRAGDVVARVGGEEFVLLLPGADGEVAGVVAERIAAAVRSHAFRAPRGPLHVTVSVGVSVEELVDAHAAGALRARGDEALYLAKRLGRDRVVLWAPGIRSNATPPGVRALSAI